jgi:hypothetical protein
MSERDPLDELAARWRRLEPPDPTAAIDGPDAATRAAIGWMRDAWRAATPAAPRALPWRLRARLLRRTALPWLAAAAAIVAVAFLLSRAGDPGRRPTGRPDPVRVAAQEPSLRSFACAPDRIELRSGPVRLILFTTTTAPAPDGAGAREEAFR